MFIRISKTQDKYFFEIGDSFVDLQESLLSSIRDNCLFPHISSKFNTFVEAHHYASDIVDNNPTMVLAKKLCIYKRAANKETGIDENIIPLTDKILECYGNQLVLIQSRIQQLFEEMDNGKNHDNKIFQNLNNEMDKIIDSIEVINQEFEFTDDEEKYMSDVYLGFIEEKNKISHLVDSESNGSELGESTLKTGGNASRDILKAFGEAAILGIENNHPSLHIETITVNSSTNGYDIVLANQNEDFIKLLFNDKLLLSNITPLSNNSVRKIYSADFLNEYWMPTVSAIGHFYDDDKKSLYIPDALKSNKLLGFNKVKKKFASKIHIQNEDTGLGVSKTWHIKTAQTKNIKDLSENEIIGKEVICIDPALPTYYQRSGQIESAIPRDDYIDLVVDFRRGLDKLVLKDSQVRILDLP